MMWPYYIASALGRQLILCTSRDGGLTWSMESTGLMQNPTASQAHTIAGGGNSIKLNEYDTNKLIFGSAASLCTINVSYD